MAKWPTGMHQAADGVILLSRRAIGLLINRNPELISRYCKALACDVRTRALLYALDEVAETLAQKKRR